MDAMVIRRAGDVLVPMRVQDLEDLRTFPEHTPLHARISKARRPKNHRHFFAAIEAAHQNWPEGHEFQAEDSEHLRAWLLCQTRFREFVDFPVLAQHAVVILIERLRGKGKYAFVREGYIEGEPAIRVYFPRSIAWAQLSETDFQQIKRCVFEVIELIIGIPADDLVRGQQRAAS